MARILVIEDDPDEIMAIRETLEAAGHLVVEARSEEEAVGAVPREAPDLIVLDVIMERLNSGFKLCREFKSCDQTKHIPILILSAISGKTGLRFSPQVDGEYLPAEGFLEKPLDPDMLVKAVRELLMSGQTGMSLSST